MRNINLLVLHCSDSDIQSHDNIKTIKEWHIKRGFSDVGYHYFIRKDGSIEVGRHIKDIGAHVRGFNKHSIGICISGRTSFTKEQFKSLRYLIDKLIQKYNLRSYDVLLHNQLDKKKTCPNFTLENVFIPS